MMQQTSILAFHSLRDKLGERQSRVLSCLASLGSASNLDISKALVWPINSVTPRMKELRDMGLLEFAGYKNCQYTNRKVCVWQLKTSEVLP